MKSKNLSNSISAFHELLYLNSSDVTEEMRCQRRQQLVSTDVSQLVSRKRRFFQDGRLHIVQRPRGGEGASPLQILVFFLLVQTGFSGVKFFFAEIFMVFEYE